MDPSLIESLAKKLWNYHQMNHELQQSDCILVLGSNDLRVPEYAASLFLKGWAPLLILSGGLGNFTRELWDEPEAVKFANIAKQMGVPEDKILIEKASTNSGENVRLTRQLLQEKEIEIQSAIVVQKPFMERRAYATIKKQWPKLKVSTSSPPIAFQDYPSSQFSLNDLIHTMVGDLQRIMIYPKMGYQTAQEIPEDVLEAYHTLMGLNYTKHLVSEA